MTPAEALREPNVRAFLKAVRHGEGTDRPDGYRVMFGGETFDNNYADHPRRAVERTLGGKPITSTAAGAYQFLARTWSALCKQYGFKDFSPESQDMGAVALIMGRKALPALLAGRLDEAVRLCCREWASLPGSPYGQPVVTMEKFTQLYTDAGGSLTEQPEKPMAPFILAALPALLEVVPKLGEIFGSGTERSDKNLKAVELAVNVAKEAIGAVNEQDLTERLQKDPTAATQVREAVEAQWFAIVDTAGTPEARKADAAFVATGAPVYRSPVFIVTLLMMPIIYAAVYAVLFTDGFSDDMKAMVLGAIFSGLLTGAISSFYYGTSQSSQRKTELLANQ